MLSDPARIDSLVDMNNALHRRLSSFNRKRMQPTTPDTNWRDTLQASHQLSLLEGQFVEAERRTVQALMQSVPDDADDFMTWFESLRESGPGQGDVLFEWLANDASLPEMCWFLEQEVAGEAGFDDLVALTQVGMPPQAKLEMARNYWDELGRGHEGRMHGPLLQRIAVELGLSPMIDRVVWESLALGNLMLGLAANRRYAYQSIGALGAVELTAPSRVSQVNGGLERLGVSQRARTYFILHASIDVKHAREWNAQVIRPLIEKDPAVRRAIAEGALLRLRAGARCFQRYRRVLLPKFQYPSSDRRASSPRTNFAPMSAR